jgi:hypothetical protein
MKEKLARWWLPLFVAVVIAWQYRAPLIGRVWFFEDIAAYFEPLWSAAARQMHRGLFGSWELAAWSGLPMLGDPQIGILYPPNWLWMILKPLRSYAWLQLFHAGFGAAGMWAAARARGRSKPAAAVAALTLALGAFCVLELRHAMFVATTAWLPWLIWAIERYCQDRRTDLLAAAAGCTGMALLAGGWSMLFFGAWVVAVIAISRTLVSENRTRVLGGLAAAALLGVGLAAVQLLPAMQHARMSPRALGVDYSFASSYAWPSWDYLLTLLIPTLWGSTARGTYAGAPDQWELCGYAIGLMATVLIPFALLHKKRRGERIALLVLSLVACDLALGSDGLLHPLFFRFVPFYASLRCPARALYVWTLAAPLLAADGLDALLAKLPSRRALVGGFVVIVVAAELLLTWRAENPSVTLAESQDAPAAAAWLRGLRKHGRMTTDVHLGQRYHNAGLSWSVESAVGYSSLPIWRYLHLLWIANHGSVYPHDKLADDLTAQGLWRFSSPLVDLLSVRYVVAPRNRPITDAGFAKVFEGPDGIDVWRNAEADPRAFVVHRARVLPEEAAQAQAIADDHFSPREVAIVDRPVRGVPEPRAGEPAPEATDYFSFFREGPQEMAFEVELDRPGVLVNSEPWYPTWTATVDDKPTELLRVDYALMGVALPAGRHLITFVCYDGTLARGAAISVTALALLIGLVLYQRRGRGRVSGA